MIRIGLERLLGVGAIALEEMDIIDLPPVIANRLHIYAKDVGGVTTLCYRNDVGLEICFTSGSGGFSCSNLVACSLTDLGTRNILDLTTAETDAALVLAPNGVGGVEFRPDTASGGSSWDVLTADIDGAEVIFDDTGDVIMTEIAGEWSVLTTGIITITEIVFSDSEVVMVETCGGSSC